jgi:hypothetical protein
MFCRSLFVFSGVRVARSLVLCVCFVDRCLSFCLLSFGHCVVCSSSMYGFWLLLWYLQTFRVTRSLVLYVCFVDYYLSFCLFSFGHCVVCSSSIYGFWLLLWYLQTVLVTRSLVLYVVFCTSLFVLLSFIFWSLCSLSCDLRLLINTLVDCVFW